MSAYRAVLFDLGNTLVHYYDAREFEPVLRRCISEMSSVMRRHGRLLDRERLIARALELNVERDDHRVWPLADRLTALLEDQAPAASSGIVRNLVDAFLTPIFAVARVDRAARRVLDELRAHGLKLAIVSNTPWGSPAAAWRAELGRLGLLERVDAAVFCTDVGWRKPAPAVFAAALARVGARPEAAVFVGDDPRWDVAGATAAGLRPILIARDSKIGAPCDTIRTLADVLPLVLP